MIYREAGDFKTSYAADGQTFPIAFDRWRYYAVLAVAFLVVPLVIDGYWSNAILLPFLIWSIAAIGLNILTGYCGQVSLGTGGFMAVGAFAAFKLMTAFPELNIVFCRARRPGRSPRSVGLAFGLPSLRIKGFYLAVATLAAQFFLVWLFNKVPWFYQLLRHRPDQRAGPQRVRLGGHRRRRRRRPPSTCSASSSSSCLAWVARNLTRGRDRPVAGWRSATWTSPPRSSASTRCAPSSRPSRSRRSSSASPGALYFAVYFGAVEVTDAFGIRVSFLVLFMIIIGGLGLDLRLLRRRGLHGADADRCLKNVMVGGARLADRPRRACRDHAGRRC